MIRYAAVKDLLLRIKGPTYAKVLIFWQYQHVNLEFLIKDTGLYISYCRNFDYLRIKEFYYIKFENFDEREKNLSIHKSTNAIIQNILR